MESILLYKDFHHTKLWEKSFILSTYSIEYKQDKARIICETMFGVVKSRFNKLSINGKTGDNYHYCLTVNGKKVYFLSTYKNI